MTITERNFHLNFYQTSTFLGVEKWKLPVLKWPFHKTATKLPQNFHFFSWKLPQKRWKFWINFHIRKWKFTRSLLEVSSKLLVSNGFYDKKIVEKDKISDYFLSYFLIFCAKFYRINVKILSFYDKNIVKKIVYLDY